MSDLNFNTPFDPFHSTQYNFLNLTGQRCHRWTVVSIYGRDKYQNVMWLCLCKCGNWGLLTSTALRKRSTHSCGCFSREQFQARSKTHGEAAVSNKTPEYRAYQHAKTRCTNPKVKHYPRYGGRGIEFRFASYEDFLHTVGRRPTPDHSLDRIDVNGHYEKGNVRWATATEQARNTRRNRYVTIDGETKCLAEWCVHYNIQSSTVQQRIKAGLPIIEAITLPLGYSKRVEGLP